MWCCHQCGKPVLESPSDQGAGAKRRLAGEAVWRDGVGGLWRRKGWETLGSQTPTKTDNVGGKTASAAWAGTAQRSERRTDVDAGYDGLREQALTFE